MRVDVGQRMDSQMDKIKFIRQEEYGLPIKFALYRVLPQQAKRGGGSNPWIIAHGEGPLHMEMFPAACGRVPAAKYDTPPSSGSALIPNPSLSKSFVWPVQNAPLEPTSPDRTWAGEPGSGKQKSRDRPP